MIFTNAEASGELVPPGPRTALTGCPWHDVKAMLKEVGLRPTRQRMALGWICSPRGATAITAEILRGGDQTQKAVAGHRLQCVASVHRCRAPAEVAVERLEDHFDTNSTLHHFFVRSGENALLDFPHRRRRRGKTPVRPRLRRSRIDIGGAPPQASLSRSFQNALIVVAGHEPANDGNLPRHCRGTPVTRTSGIAPRAVVGFTKAVIAAGALALVRDGRLALDGPLPNRPYSLRQLLQHRAGVTNYGELAAYHEAVSHGDSPWPITELLQRAEADKLRFEPGHGWLYSNIGYLFVRQLIEAVRDDQLDAALKRLVLGPLGIESARIATTPADLPTWSWAPPAPITRDGSIMA
jgi:hypothetical protein